MKSQADPNKQSPKPPGRGEEPQKDRGQGGGQPKPGNDQDYETPDIPEELPKREIDRKPSDPQSVPDKEPDSAPKQDIPDPNGSEENNDVQEKSPDLLVEDDRDTESLVDKRDRFPFACFFVNTLKPDMGMIFFVKHIKVEPAFLRGAV